MATALLSTKLKNQIKALDTDLVVELKNVRVNGEALGCTGFVTNPDTGAVTYVCTDNNHGLNTKALYRTAKHTKDYTGGRNNFAAYGDLADEVVKMANRAA